MAPLLSVDLKSMISPPLETSIHSGSLLQQLFDQDVEAAYRERWTYTEGWRAVFIRRRVLSFVTIQMGQVKTAGHRRTKPVWTDQSMRIKGNRGSKALTTKHFTQTSHWVYERTVCEPTICEPIIQRVQSNALKDGQAGEPVCSMGTTGKNSTLWEGLKNKSIAGTFITKHNCGMMISELVSMAALSLCI